MRQSAFAAFLVVVVTVAGASATPPTLQGTPNYLPLSEGASWQYKMEAPGVASDSYTIQAVKQEEKTEKSVTFRLEASKKGQKMVSETIRVDETGIARIRADDKPISKPIYLLKYPVKATEKWKDDVEIAGQKMSVEVEVGKEEEITVPAGKYKAVSSKVDGTMGGIQIVSTYWFAEGVGIVKQVIDIQGQKVLMELEKHEKGK
jgi:hypothetical protein